MLTTKKILTKTAEKFDLPYETVLANYEAWVKGFKDRLINEPVLYFSLSKDLTLFFTTKIDLAEHGSRITSRPIMKSKQVKKNLVKKVIKKLETTNSKYKAKKQVIYNHVPPLEFYGYRKGYSLTELEAIQQKMFDLNNKYEYKKNF